MNSSQNSHPLLMTPDEAAKALTISTRKLWELNTAGEIPCVRIGRMVRYKLDDLREFIAKNRHPSR